MNDLRIVGLKVENFKRLVAIEISPKGNMVELRGRNKQGKSSILDAISVAIKGMADSPDKPIREGQDKAWIELDLGDIIVERTFKESEEGEVVSKLTVTAKDGKPFTSPQAVLDKLFGSLAFDPFKFSQADKNEQVNLLKTLVKDFDFKANEKAEKEAYEERTIVNRKAKDSSVKHISFKDVPVAEPEKVDVKDLTAKMQAASEKNVEIAEQKAAREKNEKALIIDKVEEKNRLSEKYTEEILNSTKDFEEAKFIFELKMKKHEEAKEQHRVNQKNIASLQEEIEKAQASQNSLPALDSPIDTEVIKKQLDEASIRNDLHLKWQQKNEAKLEISRYEDESKALTEKIENLKLARLNAVKVAGLPVEGLGFDENGITLNGLPFDQASSAEKLRTSVALAAAQNPTLRFIQVKEGSLLDDEGLAALGEIAEKYNMQVWVEIVDSTGKCGFVIEDGSLKS